MTPHSSTRRDRFVTLTGPVMTVKTDFGYVRSPMASGEVVGDRLHPPVFGQANGRQQR